MSNLLIRSIYARRALGNPNFSKLTMIRALSAHPTSKVNPHGWKSWKDIPDSHLPKSPDPTNVLYETEEYKKIQKKRIWYQIDDGTPIYFKEGWTDRVRVYFYLFCLFSLLASEYYIIITQVAT